MKPGFSSLEVIAAKFPPKSSVAVSVTVNPIMYGHLKNAHYASDGVTGFSWRGITVRVDEWLVYPRYVIEYADGSMRIC